MGVEVGWGRGIEQKGKRTRGHGQQCGEPWGQKGIRGLNDNEKNTIKIKSTNQSIKKLNNLKD